MANADYTKEDGYSYAKLPSEGMNATKKKLDKWLRTNAGKYGFVLPLKMTDERHHWEYIGVEKTKNMDTYIDFNLDEIVDENGKDAVKPNKNESFSLRRVKATDKWNLYMKKEKD